MPTMDQKLTYSDFEKAYPDALATLLAMGKAVDDSGLEKNLTELVKLRVSQINGCTFCTELHLRVARRAGVDSARLDLLTAWRDAPPYSARERAAIAWAEHVTMTPTTAIAEDLHASLNATFAEHELVNLTIAIANINAWNRIAGALHFPPMQQENKQ
ncbi:carboxymuconolactone decarboxylase family protein [Stappia sp. ES.058]|uniref:carboxymuconolactone decarboxylase family protein n=1 Tax=Stappia sp. ES.058 TaxID=1881061 RepID=UPI00087C4AD8|nr:carboxymuconolactone decarboxylase family protein [Stappia sp. ES.058]SDU45021.1 alkylhydroperoxidase AhpD family core domain-containing protein [Stappia sp. ES.058]